MDVVVVVGMETVVVAPGHGGQRRWPLYGGINLVTWRQTHTADYEPGLARSPLPSLGPQ